MVGYFQKKTFEKNVGGELKYIKTGDSIIIKN